MRFGSLFAGIGGFDLGLERAGMECAWQVEIDDYATRVLEKHWPNVRRWRDVRDFPPEPVDEWRVDLICGGFPCQPVSDNGKKKAQDDERWLWPGFASVIRTLRPEWVLLENVPGLLRRGMGNVLGDLARCGYDAEWDSIPAATFGAPHLRERVFVVAYPASTRPEGKEPEGRIWGRGLLAQRGWWSPEPGVCRVDDGSPNRSHRLRCLGNAVVPQVSEYIGKRIMEATE